MDIRGYVYMKLLSRSQNCSAGDQWLLHHTWQCIEDTEQLVGFGIGLLAIILWPLGHVCLYRFKRSRTRSSRQRSVRLFLMMNWFSDALGLVGAGLSQQLSTQLLFGISATFVHTVCCVHSFFAPIDGTPKTSHKHERKKSGHRLSKRSVFRACICPLNTVLLAIACVGYSLRTFTSAAERDTTEEGSSITQAHLWIPVEWVVGYVFGSMAGVLHCCAKVLDILDSYISVEFHCVMIVAYVSSILGELGYVISVWTQESSAWFYGHTLPWVLPRMIGAGIDMGILVQRVLQKRQGKRRTLSEEDAECLLSSESDREWLSSDSEEVVWMPLKSVDSAIPTHPVCISRVQILSESDKCVDTIDWFEKTDGAETKADMEVLGTQNDSKSQEEESAVCDQKPLNSVENCKDGLTGTSEQISLDSAKNCSGVNEKEYTDRKSEMPNSIHSIKTNPEKKLKQKDD